MIAVLYCIGDMSSQMPDQWLHWEPSSQLTDWDKQSRDIAYTLPDSPKWEKAWEVKRTGIKEAKQEGRDVLTRLDHLVEAEPIPDILLCVCLRVTACMCYCVSKKETQTSYKWLKH